MSDDDDLSNEYSQRRSLRPRKIENYRQLIEGDQGTLKAIEDEVKELKVKYSGDSSDDYPGIESFESNDDDDIKKKKRGQKKKGKKNGL